MQFHRLCAGLYQNVFRCHVRGHSKLSGHSQPLRFSNGTMCVRVLPALMDNYMYLLVDEKTKIAAAVDPVEPEKILQAVEEEGASLTSILTTHHHKDHSGGNVSLCASRPGLDVYAADKRIKTCTKMLDHNETFWVGDLVVTSLLTPCHTLGAVSYYVTGKDGQEPLVFTGDTLFQGGCGRLFEGNANQLYHALYEVLGKLPPETVVYCGHEYTVANMKFAKRVYSGPSKTEEWLIEKRDPEDYPRRTGQHFVKDEWADIVPRLERAQKLRWQKDGSLPIPTIPSTIGDEKKYNPFMRVKTPAVKRFVEMDDPVEVMGELRKLKNAM